jgi:hypothetical protein
MNRRELLQCAALIVSGASASRLGFALSDEQWHYLATAPDYTEREPNYLDGTRRAVIAAMAEAILPATETPGALAAGVPRYLELMVQDWFNDQERAIFDAGLAHMVSEIPRQYGRTFDQLDAAQQREILEKMEEDAGESSWYELGNIQRDFVSDAPFICQVKELTIWGFFTSETGATQVLRHNPMPMRFDGDIPLSPEESTWDKWIL